MTRADGASVQITVFRPRIAAVAFRCAIDVAEARSKRREDRIESADHLLFAPDHHAVAALIAPDTARGTDIHVVDSLGRKRLRATDVVAVEGVAAVDNGVTVIEQLCELCDRFFRG